jgi:hypothetical protein
MFGILFLEVHIAFQSKKQRCTDVVHTEIHLQADSCRLDAMFASSQMQLDLHFSQMQMTFVSKQAWQSMNAIEFERNIMRALATQA